MNKLLLLFFFCLQFCTCAYAQVLEGTVTDRETKEIVAGVAIQNKHSGAVVFSADDGRFAITAFEGDTLLFRHTGYMSEIEVMTFTLTRKYRTIAMQPQVYKLKEATIKGRTKYQQDSIELHQQFDHELTKILVPKPKYLGIACIGCFGWLADKITGNSKKPKAFRKNFATDDMARFVESRYTYEIVQKLTGVKDSDIVANFMYAYPMEYDFARAATDLELKAWIRNSYKQFLHKQSGK